MVVLVGGGWVSSRDLRELERVAVCERGGRRGEKSERRAKRRGANGHGEVGALTGLGGAAARS